METQTNTETTDTTSLADPPQPDVPGVVVTIPGYDCDPAQPLPPVADPAQPLPPVADPAQPLPPVADPAQPLPPAS